ncbi:MAG: SpoIID/LytB domain-containing protein, partial [Candidatus Udaeobacter sp.]
MLSFRLSKLSVLPLLYSFAVPSLAIAQQRGEEIRPRRTKSEPEIQQPAVTSNTKPAVTTDAQWKVPEHSIASAAATTHLSGPEPLMRIALATDVRAASVSTSSRLLSSTDPAETYTALAVGRVRIESRVLAPLPPTEETFAVKVNGLASRADAESKARAIREATSDQSQIVLDVETQTWGLLVGPRRAREAAEIAQMRLEDAGYPATVLDLSPPSTDQAVKTATPSIAPTATTTTTAPLPLPTRTVSNPNVRLASRSSIATRELIASNSANGKLFSSSAPVLFASDDEARAPVRFNEKPYRGRIEVFANTHGLLTVVNVIGLEDYVRGVVANELSPGGFPAIEALKAQAIAA